MIAARRAAPRAQSRSGRRARVPRRSLGRAARLSRRRGAPASAPISRSYLVIIAPARTSPICRTRSTRGCAAMSSAAWPIRRARGDRRSQRRATLDANQPMTHRTSSSRRMSRASSSAASAAASCSCSRLGRADRRSRSSYLRCGSGFGLGGGKGTGKRQGQRHRASTSRRRPARCTVRVTAEGITVDGAKKTRDEAVALCKKTDGAMVTVTGDARQGDWDELRAALAGRRREDLHARRAVGRLRLDRRWR